MPQARGDGARGRLQVRGARAARRPAGVEKWGGPYIKEPDLKDAWGNEYRYTTPGTGKGFDLVSLGADGKDGGEGENRDIRN